MHVTGHRCSSRESESLLWPQPRLHPALGGAAAHRWWVFTCMLSLRPFLRHLNRAARRPWCLFALQTGELWRNLWSALTNGPCTHFNTLLYPVSHLSQFWTFGPWSHCWIYKFPQKAPIIWSLSSSFLPVMKRRMDLFPWCYYKTMITCPRWLSFYKFSHVAEASSHPPRKAKCPPYLCQIHSAQLLFSSANYFSSQNLSWKKGSNYSHTLRITNFISNRDNDQF